MLTTTRVALATLALFAFSCAAAIAQTEPNQAPQVQPNQTAQQNAAQATDVDLFIVPAIIDANNAEVALGNVAEQRAQSSGVKAFAKEMVKDHTEMLNSARQLDQKLKQQIHPESAQKTPAAGVLFQIDNEIAQACLASAEKALEQQQGAGFDLTYVGMQVGIHQHAAAALTAFEKHATSPELKEAIQQASQKVQQHLDHATKLWTDLAAAREGQAEQAQQPSQREQR